MLEEDVTVNINSTGGGVSCVGNDGKSRCCSVKSHVVLRNLIRHDLTLPSIVLPHKHRSPVASVVNCDSAVVSHRLLISNLVKREVLLSFRKLDQTLQCVHNVKCQYYFQFVFDKNLGR